jgi:hypothetical protein
MRTLKTVGIVLLAIAATLLAMPHLKKTYLWAALSGTCDVSPHEKVCDPPSFEAPILGGPSGGR